MNNLKYLLIILLVFFSSCQEEDEFKVPVDVQFSLELIQENNSKIQFSEIELAIESFSFEGEREQSEDVEFSKEYEPGLRISANPSTIIEEFDMTIPQGIYTSIAISMETAYSEQNPGLVLKGLYQLPTGNIPVIISLTNQVYLEMEAENEFGNKEIIIKSESPPSALIRFNPVSWFQSVPQAMLMDADKIDQNDGSIIYISEEHNEDIFEILMTRIDNDAIINFYN